MEQDIKEARAAFDGDRLGRLLVLQLKCFPSKEQVIEWIEDFYRENPQ